MSTRPTPPPHGTFKEWLDHYPRIMGSVRWFITVGGFTIPDPPASPPATPANRPERQKAM